MNRNPSDNPFYREPDNPNYRHRARHHDYCRPAHYMITLRKSPDIPSLSIVSGNLSIKETEHLNAPKTIPSAAGLSFITAAQQWCRQYPQLQIDCMVVMPDHIHFCLNVKAYLRIGLSRAIANLMGKTTVAYNNGKPEQKIKFFSKGFTDSIAYSGEQYQTQRQYILDNPRRYLMKRYYPDLYRMKWIISAGDLQVMAMGNIHLLKNPHIQVVRFSRRFDSARLAENDAAYLRCIDNGGALISPFIHPYEKRTRDLAIEAGGNIIRICDNGFSERFAPAKTEFDLMGSHRLLLIAPVAYNSQKQELKYSFAQKLNSLAEFLASHPADLRISPAK